MFLVNGTEITLSRGDTGAVRLSANVTRLDTGGPYTFGERDRAVFSIKSGDIVMKEKCYQMTNNAFICVFINQDTARLNPGGYSWDVRYVINAKYDTDAPEGEWTDYSDLTFPVAQYNRCKHNGAYYIARQTIETSEDFTPAHWVFADTRIPVGGDQVITPNTPMGVTLLTVVGEILPREVSTNAE